MSRCGLKWLICRKPSAWTGQMGLSPHLANRGIKVAADVTPIKVTRERAAAMWSRATV
jgi:hypothetical protein